jgi:hypothetical protein
MLRCGAVLLRRTNLDWIWFPVPAEVAPAGAYFRRALAVRQAALFSAPVASWKSGPLIVRVT